MIDFPASPTNGQEFTGGNNIYVYNGYGWTAKAAAGTPYVQKTGDTMTGVLAINTPVGTNANLYVNAGATAQASQVVGQKTGLLRWICSLGDSTAEAGGNVGSDFGISRFSNAGALLEQTFSIMRSDGRAVIRSVTPSTSPTTGALTVAGGVGIGGALYVAGDVIIRATQPILQLDRSGSGTAAIHAKKDGLLRWGISFVGADESGGNTGSDFSVIRCNDAGAVLANALTVTRAAGNVLVASGTPSTSYTTGALTVAGGVGIGGALHINSGNSNIKWDSSSTWAFIFTPHGANLGGGPAAFNNSGGSNIGSINFSGAQAGITYNTTSDVRGKPNREPLSPDTARDIIDALEVYDFDKDGNAIRGIGLVAQQAHAVHKSLASPGMTDDDWWMAEKAAPMPFVIANMQLLNKEIAELKQQLKEKH